MEKKKTGTINDEKPLSPAANPFMMNTAGILLIIFSLFIGAGIFSRNPGEEQIQIFGIFGDVLIQIFIILFGKTAIIAPAFGIAWGFHMITAKKIWSRRMIGFLLLGIDWALYYSMEKIPRGLTPWEAAGYGLGGGYAGGACLILLLKLVGEAGSSIVWAVLFAAGILLIVHSSPIKFWENPLMMQYIHKIKKWMLSFIFYEEGTEEKEKSSPSKLEKQYQQPEQFLNLEKNLGKLDLPNQQDHTEKTLAEYPLELPGAESGQEAVQSKKVSSIHTGKNFEKTLIHSWTEEFKQEKNSGLVLMEENSAKEILMDKKEEPLQLFGESAAKKNKASAAGIKTKTKPKRKSKTVSKTSRQVQKEAPAGQAGPLLPDPHWILKKSQALEKKLAEFGIPVNVREVNYEPLVTRFEVQLAMGVKPSQILQLKQDSYIHMGMPGIHPETAGSDNAVVWIEIPNKVNPKFSLQKMLDSPNFQNRHDPLAFALGKDIISEDVYADLEKMPHLLAAGGTSSEIASFLHSIFMSILFHEKEQVQFVFINSRIEELKIYHALPSLFTPAVNSPEQGCLILKAMLLEMENRYKKLEESGVQDIRQYHEKYPEKMPYIVIVVDELADLMQAAAGETEHSIYYLAKMGKSVGVHLAAATQKPFHYVITEAVTAHISSRIAFRVLSAEESRLILGREGAENLQGNGEMLFVPQGACEPEKIQGVSISKKEIEKTISFITQCGQNKVQYNGEPEHFLSISPHSGNQMEKELIIEAVKLFIASKKASASLLQRRLHISFKRASLIMDELEKQGLISPADKNHPAAARKVLASENSLKQLDLFK